MQLDFELLRFVFFHLRVLVDPGVGRRVPLEDGCELQPKRSRLFESGGTMNMMITSSGDPGARGGSG